MQEIVNIVKTMAVLVGLAYFSVEDIRKKEIRVVPIAVLGIAGILLSLFGGQWTDWHILQNYVPGIVCLILGKLSREAIGYGDGLVILCLGSYLNITQMMELCLITVTLTGIAALFLMVVCHRTKKATLPLMPYLFAGYLLTRCI